MGARIRLRDITWPRRKTSVVVIIFQVIISLLSVVVSLLVGILVFDFVRGRVPSGWEGPVAVASALGVIVGLTALGFYIIEWERLEGVRRRRWLRWKRLCRLVTWPDALARCPHRVFEHAVLKTGSLSKAVKRVGKLTPPGFVIVGRGVPNDVPYWLGWPRRMDTPFEPIDYTDGEMLGWLAVLNWEEEDTWEAEFLAGISDANLSPRIRNRRQAWRGALGSIWNVFWLLFFVGQLVRAIRSGSWAPTLVVLAIFIPGVVIPLVIEKRYWIVPGGLARRVGMLWRQKPRLEFFSPADTTLVIAWDKGEVMAVRHGRIHKFMLEDAGPYALLAGWLSTAPTPSEAQLQGLLNPSAETH